MQEVLENYLNAKLEKMTRYCADHKLYYTLTTIYNGFEEVAIRIEVQWQ